MLVDVRPEHAGEPSLHGARDGPGLSQASGRKLEECEGECEVDTGRRIGADQIVSGADQIVSGEIQKVGSRYQLTLRLHDTHHGQLLASSIASGKSIDELDEGAVKAAEELLILH